MRRTRRLTALSDKHPNKCLFRRLHMGLHTAHRIAFDTPTPPITRREPLAVFFAKNQPIHLRQSSPQSHHRCHRLFLQYLVPWSRLPNPPKSLAWCGHVERQRSAPPATLRPHGTNTSLIASCTGFVRPDYSRSFASSYDRQCNAHRGHAAHLPHNFSSRCHRNTLRSLLVVFTSSLSLPGKSCPGRAHLATGFP